MKVRIATMIRTTVRAPHAQDGDDHRADTPLRAVPIIDKADEA